VWSPNADSLAVALQSHASCADDSGVSTHEDPVCEICGQPVGNGGDVESMVVIMTSQGQEFVRHQRCHMLELLDRA
jgi:hypothetical protein